MTFLGALVVSAGVFFTVWELLGAHGLKAQPRLGSSTLFDLVRLSLGVVAGAGAGALVALVVADRKQRLDEEGSRLDTTRLHNERFTTAVGQLGDSSAAVRLGGVHALAGLADDAPTRELRQTTIDALCAFLRLPCAPDPGDGEPGRADYLASREVRHTIIRLVRDHLRLDTDHPHSWQGHDFDFTGTVFEGGDFSEACFSGGTVSFDRAEFSGGTVTFDEAQFSGGTVTFIGAEFSGGTVTFDEAQFSGGTVNFSRAQFSGSDVNFTRAHFTGSDVSFFQATFTCGAVAFDRAQFSGGRAAFNLAQFSGGEVTFAGAQFTGSYVILGQATFSGGAVTFIGAQFSGGTVTFNDPQLSGCTISFDEARFSGGTVRIAFLLSTVPLHEETPWGLIFPGPVLPSGLQVPDRWRSAPPDAPAGG